MINIAQISSFYGNLGDSLSHEGLKLCFQQAITNPFKITPFEIRRTYNNYSESDKLSLDISLAKYFNQYYDYLVIGGGSFLEPFEATHSKLRIEYTADFFSSLEIPLLFSSIGIKPRQASLESAHVESINSLFHNLEGSQYSVLARNDGSFEWFHTHLNSSNMIDSIDNAFFASTYPLTCNQYLSKSKYFTVNLGYDQIKSFGEEAYKLCIHNLSNLIEYLAVSMQLRCLYVCHTPFDIFCFQDICQNLPDWTVRRYMSFENFIPGIEGVQRMKESYNFSELNIAMRFHANILSLLSGSPHISIHTLDRVDSLFNSLQYSPMHLCLSSPEFEVAKVQTAICDLLDTSNINHQSLNAIELLKSNTLSHLVGFFK